MKQFLNIVIGTDDFVSFLGLVFFALLGVFLGLLLNTTKRDINSESTPFEFSWKFLLSDNVKRIVAGLILIYLSLRFTNEIFGVSINNFWSVCIGLASDQLAQFVKAKTNILNSRK